MPTENIKYDTLVNVLDKLRHEAPEEFRTYHATPDETERLNKARAKSFIHLFLKVKCNLASFKERHSCITDESYDGGIDAYFFNYEKKKLFLVQSKFRITSDGFKTRSMSADDLIKMEIVRILRGEGVDSSGNVFNAKILELQKKYRELTDQAKWETEIIFLGNLTKYNEDQVKKLIDNYKFQVYDYERTYNELVYPLCCGTFYDPSEISITINLNDDGGSTLKRKIITKYGDFDVRVLFVPVIEIGRILSKYRNSILRFNPRNYLSLSQNKVNKGIRDSITQSDTNEFAIFNNGLTIVANTCQISETTGEINVGQIIMTNPQIINGGQTAYTLSKIWDEYSDHSSNVFHPKEVMVKIIILKDYEKLDIKLIEELSNSTNQQSKVEEADRRSNEVVQLDIQSRIYHDFGYYYERKKGEFYYGLNGGFINKELVIDRYSLLRAYMAFKGQPRWARQRGSEVLFRGPNFTLTLDNADDYKKMFFSYCLLKKLYDIKGFDDWGEGLRYGKMAIISAVSKIIDQSSIESEGILEFAGNAIDRIKTYWLKFESWAKAQPLNIVTYGKHDGLDFDNYYKGKTIDADIDAYFSQHLVLQLDPSNIAKPEALQNSLF